MNNITYLYLIRVWNKFEEKLDYQFYFKTEFHDVWNEEKFRIDLFERHGSEMEGGGFTYEELKYLDVDTLIKG